MEETQERWNVYIPERNTTVNVPKNWDYSTIMSELDKKQKEEQKNLNQEVAKIQGEKYRSLSKPTYNFSYYNDLLESLKEKKIGEETSPIKTGAKSFVNQLYDLTVGATIRGVGQTSDIVENAVGTFQARKLSPKQREKFLKEIDKEGRESARKAQESAEKFAPFKIREGESKTAQGLSSALVSFGLMGLSGALNGLSKGMTVKEGLQKGLPIATLFGVSSGQEMYGKVREGGGSSSEALLKGESAMLGEIALEEAGVATLLKGVRAKIFAPYPWAGFIVTSAGTGAVQETSQGLKDVIIAGKYDERVNEEKLNELLDDAIFGAIGEMFGGVVSSTAHRERRAKIRNQAVKAGYDEQTANVIAWEATENPEGIANAVIDEMKDFNNVLSAEDIQRGQEFIEEAQRIGGKDADTYVNIMNTYKQVGKLGGLTEEEIRKDAEYFANAHTSLFLALKDKDPNLTYEQYADKIKLNSLRIIQDINVEREVNKRVKETLPWFGETSELTAEQVDEVERVAQNERFNVMREAGLIKEDDTLYSMIGERSKLTKQQKTSLDEAKSLEQDGLLSNEQIRQTTGWYRGDDNKWHLEISDRDATLTDIDIKENAWTLGDLLKHKTLFSAIPQMKAVSLRYNPNMTETARVVTGIGGVRLEVGAKYFKESQQEKRKDIMHEVQHIIQGFEKFAKGGVVGNFRSPRMKLIDKVKWNTRIQYADLIMGMGKWKSFNEVREKIKTLENTDDELLKSYIEKFKQADEYLKEYDMNTAFQKYRRLAGEIEARNVANRIDLTDEERRKISPEETRDIPREQAIIRFDDKTESNYTPEYNPYIVNKVSYKGKEVKPYGKGIKGLIATDLAVGKTEEQIKQTARESIDYAQSQLDEINKLIDPARAKLSDEVAKEIEDIVASSEGRWWNYENERSNADEQNYLDLLLSQEDYQDSIKVANKILKADFSDYSVSSIDDTLYSRVGYASMRRPLEGTALSTTHYGEGESGHMTHGWGNYVLFDRKLNEKNYYDRWSNVKKSYYYNGNPLTGVLEEIANGDKTKEEALKEFDSTESYLDKKIAFRKELIQKVPRMFFGQNLTEQRKQEAIAFQTEEYKREIEDLEEEKKELKERRKILEDFDVSKVEKVVYYPNMKYKGKVLDKYNDNFGNFMWHVAETAESQEELDQEIKEHIEAFRNRLKNDEEIAKEYEDKLTPAEIKRAKEKVKKAKTYNDLIERGEAAEHLFGDDNTYSLYKEALFSLRAKKKQLSEMESYGKIDFKDIERYADAQQWSAEVPDIDVMLQEGEPFKKQSPFVQEALERLNIDMAFPKQKEVTFDNVEEAERFYEEQQQIYELKAKGFERFMPKIIDNPDGTITIKYSDKFVAGDILDETRSVYGEGIYERLVYLLGSRAAASIKLLEYGIKGIDYWGGIDKHGAVVFEDVPVIERLLSRYNASYSDAKKIIRLFKGHNPQALVHELSHNFFMDYFRLTEEYGLTEKNKAIYDMLGKNSYKEFGEKEWETITEEFMKYLKTNEAPNIALSGLFRRAKDWLIETFFTTNKSETPSPEVKEFFDNLVKDEYGTVDATSLRMTPRAIKDIIKDIKSGNEISFQGVRRSDLKALRKIFHQTRPRKAKTLAEEMRKDDMRIKADSELAKQLGYDPKKKQPMFDKNGTIERIDELDDYLVEKGLLEPNQTETAEQVSDRENQIENIINQAEDVYSAAEQTYADYRDIVEQNQLKAQELVNEILKDNELGIKSIDEINEYLDKAIDMAKSVDSILVNKEAIKFLVEGYENAEKLYNKTLEELQKAQDVIGVRQQLTDYIRSLPLNAKHRLSLINKVKQVNKGEDFTEVLGNINDSFKQMWEQETKEILANNINEILKSTKPKERRKQKYNYDYNTLFEELRIINGYTKAQANEAYDALLNEIRDSDSVDYVETDEDREINAIKRLLISYKMNGRKDSSIALMKRLEDELFKLRQDAIEDKARTDTEKAIKKRAEIDRAVGYIKSSKPVNKVLGFYLKNTNLYSNEAELFGKNWAKAHEMESVELEQNRKVKAKTKQMIEKGKKIYGIPDDTGSRKMFKNSDKEFARIINEKSQENFTLHGVNGKATNLERKISLLQIMDIYNTIKNKNSAEIYAKLYETFDEQGNQTSHQIQGLIDNLSEQDKAFADAIMADIQSLREAENEIYVKLYGIDMPKHEPYYPRSAERVEGELMDIKKFAIGDDTPSFFKERAKMSLLVPRNMWTKYQSRINDSMYMTNTFEKYKEHYDLIHNSEVKNAIEAKYDTKRYMALNTSLKDLSLGGNSKAFDDMENFMSNLVSNWVVSKIALNDAVFTKQLLSMTNFIENMPVSDFFKYSLEMMTNPKKAYKFMQDFDGAYLNQRFSEGMQNEALAQIMANAERSVKKRDYIFQDYIDFVTLPVRLGDVGAIYLGGYARARYLLEHGTPIEEARKIFEFESQQSQQSGLKASMAQFQKNTIFRFFTAFKNTQLQYQRKMLDGFIQWRRGEIDTKHYAKILGNYAFLQAFMYQIATNIFSYWRDDDDDKEFDWSKDVAMQIITSPVAGVPLLGDMTQNLLKKQSYDLGIAGLQDANKAIRLAKKSFDSLIEGEFDPKTAEKAGALMLQFVKPMPANILTSILND